MRACKSLLKTWTLRLNAGKCGDGNAGTGGNAGRKTGDRRDVPGFDWQGSIRAESNPSTRLFTESLAFAPFGERYALKGAPFNVDSFTGKPDQLVPDEYDFPAREEHNGQGRWVSPDPMRGTGNKYVYADNNPLSNVDLYGLFPSNEGVDYTGDDGISSDPSSEPLYQEESHPSVSVQTDGQIAPQLTEQTAIRADQSAQNQGCKYDACVSATAPKKSFWGRVGGWLGGAAVGIVRWGKLGGPEHRAGVARVAKSLKESGYEVEKEVRVPTPNGAKSSRWVDVVGTRNGETRMYQIGRQNLDGTPVAREVQALDDIEGATGIRPNFLPYNVGEPNFGVPGATDIAPGVTPGEGEVPVDPEIIPE